MKEATTAIEVRASTRGLVITEKYMGFVNYLYPMTVNWHNKHRVFREIFLKAMFSQIELFHLAAKSDQISRLYAADAGLSVLREFLRFATNPKRKLLSRHQHEVAEVHLAETGSMLGTWINKMQKGRSR